MVTLPNEDESSVPRSVRHLLACLGLAYLVLALAVNERTVSWLAGFELLPSGRTKIRVAQTTFAGLGVLTFLGRRREWIARTQLLLLSSTVAVPILAELVFRLAIALELPSARNPSLYSDYLSEDDYFKLAVAWGHTHISERMAHPLLGWAPPVTPSNPLGIIRSAPYEVIRERPVLFFGDSYVAGATGSADGIPHHLERLLDGHTVYNYGVSGYGVDQIVLRVETVIDRFSAS